MIKSIFLTIALFLLAGDFVAVCGGQVREYHSAGVALAVPEGFEHQPGRSATEIVRAVKYVSAKQRVFVVLSAQPVKAGVSAEEYAGQTEAKSRQAGDIKNLEILKRTTIPIATLAGVGRLMSFTSDGQSAVAIRVYFIREAANSSPRVCYVLSVTAPASHRNLVVPTLGKITQTLKLIEFRHPSVDDITQPGAAVEDKKRGYSMAVPHGWHWKRTVTGMELGVTDYLLGGIDSPLVNITVASIGPGVDATDCGLKFLGMLIQDVSAQGLVTKPLERSEVKMGGLDAYQVVVRQAELSAGRTGDKTAAPPRRSRIVVQRTICATAKYPGQETPQRNSYVLTVICRGSNAKAAAELAEKLSAGFTILAPTKPVAATSPAGPAG